MKMQPGFVAALAWAGTSSAHYIFQQLSVGGSNYGVFEGIRQNTNYNSPVTDLKSKDLVCNQGGLSGDDTVTLNVKAGDSFSWTTDTPVYHQGPVSLFVSRAPQFAHDYDGSAGWRKMHDWTPEIQPNGQTKWPLYQKYEGTIPKCLPTGQYLLRIQSLGIHNPWPAGVPQFYISCAQLNVTGGPDAMPLSQWSQPVDIPGVFKQTDSGYTANIYDPNFSSYEVPGGEVMGC